MDILLKPPQPLMGLFFEVLQLNDNRLYDTPVNLQTCNLADVPNLFLVCPFVKKKKTICMA